jgi:hypothetical protein
MHASLTLHFAFFTIFAFFAFYAKVPFFLQFHFLASTSIDLSTSRVADGLPFDTETPEKRIVEILASASISFGIGIDLWLVFCCL